jgi:hypothetical protein
MHPARPCPIDAARLVFIDETSANTKMMRLHGRCVRGERLVDHVPQGHWKTITFVAAQHALFSHPASPRPRHVCALDVPQRTTAAGHPVCCREGCR